MLIYSIVVTWNATKWIDKCFGSLISSATPTKILVIDNNSKDGTPKIIRLKFPMIEVIESRHNLGFGKANNIGIRIALDRNADYFFLLNQDSWVEPDTIGNLISIQDPDYAILSPIHLNGQGNAFDFWFATYLIRSLTPDMLYDLYICRSKPIYETHYVNAAAWLLNKKCIDIVGGFDPSFFMYGEDDNYMLRVKYHRLKIGICFTAKIYHDREFHDDKRWDGLYAMKKSVFVLLKDINNPITKQITKYLLSQGKNTLSNILHFHLKKIAFDFVVLLSVLSSFFGVLNSRVQAKKRRAFL